MTLHPNWALYNILWHTQNSTGLFLRPTYRSKRKSRDNAVTRQVKPADSPQVRLPRLENRPAFVSSRDRLVVPEAGEAYDKANDKSNSNLPFSAGVLNSLVQGLYRDAEH